MTNLLLMIELTVSFYATQVIWQVGTHPSAYRHAGQPPKDQRAHHSVQVSATPLAAAEVAGSKGWRWPHRPHRKDFTDTSTAAALISPGWPQRSQRTGRR